MIDSTCIIRAAGPSDGVREESQHLSVHLLNAIHCGWGESSSQLPSIVLAPEFHICRLTWKQQHLYEDENLMESSYSCLTVNWRSSTRGKPFWPPSTTSHTSKPGFRFFRLFFLASGLHEMFSGGSPETDHPDTNWSGHRGHTDEGQPSGGYDDDAQDEKLLPECHLLHLLWIRWRSWILPSSRTTQRFSRWSCRGALEPQSIRWALCSLLLIFRKWLMSQIFQGPIEIARVFLQELFEGKVPSKHENKLRLCFKVSKIFLIVVLLCRSTQCRLHYSSLTLRTFWRSQETPWKGTGSLSRRTRRLTRTSWRRATTHAWSTSSHFSGGASNYGVKLIVNKLLSGYWWYFSSTLITYFTALLPALPIKAQLLLPGSIHPCHTAKESNN